MPDEPALMAPPERPGEDYVVEMLQTLWPDPAVVCRVGPGTVVRGRRVARFAALPNADRPRALLPRAPRAAAAAALARLTDGPGAAARLRSTGLRLLASAGLVRALPQGFVVTAPADAVVDDVASHLESALGRPLAVSLKIGPVRAVQKPVLHLLSPDGATVGYAKIGTTGFSASLVRTEAAALRLLGTHEWTHLRVPTVLHDGRWQGHEVLVQEPLEGRPWAGERDAVRAAMVEVARSQGVAHHLLRESRWWKDLEGRIERLPAGDATDALRDAARRLVTSRGGESLSFGCRHTDWAPWNIAMDGPTVLVWDWEQFEQDVPLGLDAVHFDLQQLVVLQSVDPREAYDRLVRTAPGVVGAFGVPTEQAALTVALYLLETTCRYLQDGETGTRLSRVDLWLRDTLADLDGALERELRRVGLERAGGVGGG